MANGRVGTVGATAARRLSANLHTYKTGWHVAVVLLAAGLLLVLVGQRRWTVLLPAG